MINRKLMQKKHAMHIIIKCHILSQYLKVSLLVAMSRGEPHDLTALEAPVHWERSDHSQIIGATRTLSSTAGSNDAEEFHNESHRENSEKPSQSDESVRSEVTAEDLVVEWLLQMALTDERFLRATPAHRVIERAGGILRKRRANFAYSQSVKEISKFISHSWQASALIKILTLQMFYNWKAAVLAGNLCALLGMILFACGLLPGFDKTQRFGGTEPVLSGVWSLAMGVVGTLLVWFFRKPRDMVFLDRICINQKDPAEKLQGVMNIGACLKNSKKLLVIWDETYCRRLWCLFELAAFLKTHEDDALLVQPVCVAKLVVSCFLLNLLTWGGGLLLPYDSVFTPPVVIVGACAYGCLVATTIVRYYESLDLIQSQLQNFQFADAQCYCCSVNHADSSGEKLACDREVMRRCVQHWFGSVEEFEKSVQTRVRDALSHHFGGQVCSYPLLVAAAITLLWAMMDSAASSFLQQDKSGAISRLILGLSGAFVSPAGSVGILIASIRVMRYMKCPCPTLQKMLAGIVFTIFQVLTQSWVEWCLGSFEAVLGAVIFGASQVLPNMMLWKFASRFWFRSVADWWHVDLNSRTFFF